MTIASENSEYVQLAGLDEPARDERATVRALVWKIVSQRASNYGNFTTYWPARVFEGLIFLTISVIIIITLLSTEDSVERIAGWSEFQNNFEGAVMSLFTLEYLLRLWACVEDAKIAQAGPLRGRLTWAAKPLSILDLALLVPYYIDFVTVERSPASQVRGATTLQALRLLRIFSIMRLERELKSFKMLAFVLAEKSTELLITLFICSALVLISAATMYFLESEAQPHKFSSVTNSMWWSVSALTTVGYGDIAPVTGPGRVLACMVAFLGIGVFAIPTGIIGAGFLEVYNRENNMFPENLERNAAVGHDSDANTTHGATSILESIRERSRSHCTRATTVGTQTEDLGDVCRDEEISSYPCTRSTFSEMDPGACARPIARGEMQLIPVQHMEVECPQCKHTLSFKCPMGVLSGKGSDGKVQC